MTAVPTAPNNVIPFPVPQHTFQRGDEVELAEAARRQLETSELTYDQGSFWRYDPAVGIWLELRTEVVNQVFVGFAGSPLVKGSSLVPLSFGNSQINGARAILRNALVARPQRRQFLTALPGLAFRNGFVKVENGKIIVLPHSADHLAQHVYPFDYQPWFCQASVFNYKVATPQLLGFLHTLFADVSYEERQQRIALYQEFVGTCLIGDAVKYQQALVFNGGGGEGKSEALALARSVFPAGSVVSLPPQLWSERFQIARLVGARANFVDEIPERDITGGEVFKSVITGEPTHAERKHQAPFDFNPVAGHIFSANLLPGTVDQSDGYWRRLSILSFTRNMVEAPHHRPHASRSVIAAELPAIVAWFLEGAARVQRQGGYTIPQSSVEMMAAWRKEADSVMKFATEECVPHKTLAMSAKALFEAYTGWAKFNQFAPMSSGKFYRRFTTAAAKAGLVKEHTETGNIYLCRVRGAAAYRNAGG